MPAHAPERRHLVARKAALTRHHPDHVEAIAAVDAELKAARVADYLRREVAAAPPLTVEQRAGLAAVILGGAA
jgi:hypothetical protein